MKEFEPYVAWKLVCFDCLDEGKTPDLMICCFNGHERLIVKDAELWHNLTFDADYRAKWRLLR